MSTNNRYLLITFDVYTALFDIESSLTPVVEATLTTGSESPRLVQAWGRKQIYVAGFELRDLSGLLKILE